MTEAEGAGGNARREHELAFPPQRARHDVHDAFLKP
jgi:hypothetical protein